MTTTMTLEGLKRRCIEPTLHYHHSASARGYIGAKEEPRVYEYLGRYGKGYTVEYPNKEGLPNGRTSNAYHRIEYYIY